MPEPYHLTIRFRQQGGAALLDLETESGAGDAATMQPPFAGDLPLVLRALDLAQYPNPAPLLARLPTADRTRLGELGLLDGQVFVRDLHARVGQALLAALIDDPQAAAIVRQARDAAQAARRGLALNLRFPPNATQFADLPWELLWDVATQGGVPLLLAHGGYSACVRYLTLPQPRPAPAPPGSTLTILAVSPYAELSDALRARQRDALRSALAPAITSGAVSLITPEPPLTAGTLVELARHHRPTVLSYYGHGELRDGTGHLLLDASGGGGEWVAASRLAPLAQANVQLLLLHACRSDQPGAGLLTSTAGQLSALGLPAIVAMQSYIRITAAIHIQAMLCQGIAAGQSVQEALAWARAVLYAEERDATSWYVPTLTIASRSEEPLVLLAATPERPDPGLAALSQAGVRRQAHRFARGIVGTSALALLAATSVLPLITGGFTWDAIAPLLAGLGGNALSGWLMSWAEQNLSRSGWLDKDDEECTLGVLAGDLEQQIATSVDLRDELAALLERTEAIPVALAALGEQVDAQTDLLLDLGDRLKAQETLFLALRADLRRSDLIQGRLHSLLFDTLAAQTTTLLEAYSAGTERLSTELRTVLAEIQALRNEPRVAQAPPATLPQPTKIQTGGVSFDGASIGAIGSVTGGDSYRSDQVAGDKHEYHAPVTINPAPPAAPDPVERERDAQLRAYLSALIPTCNQLTLSDVDDLDPDQRTVPLDSVYIRIEVASTVKPEPTQRGQKDDEEAERQARLFGQPERQLTALEALVRQRQLVLLGPPGSGKSTFVNHLSYCLARASLGDSQALADLGDAWPHGALLPIRVVLREFATWIGKQKRKRDASTLLWGYLCEELELPETLVEHLREQTGQGRAILLLDGLDEVPATMLPRLRQAIAALRGFAPNALVTCRVLDYAEPERQLAGWPDEQIIPLSSSLQQQFVERWYAVLKVKQRPVSGGDYDSLRTRLQAQVQSRDELRRMAGNPLLLTMMAQLHAFRGELPAKRVLLYGECIDLLLRRWRPQVGRPDLRQLLGLSEWSNSETLRLLERLGYVTHRRATPPADGKGAQEVDLPRDLLIATAEQFFRPYDPTRSHGRAEAFCNYIGLFSNGVLQQHGQLIFRFPHRTFQEYLAACRLTGQGGWEQAEEESLHRRVLGVAGQAQWREALLMAASQLVLNRQPYEAIGMAEALFYAYREHPRKLAGYLVLAGEILAEIGRAQVFDLGAGKQQLWGEVLADLVTLLGLDPDGIPLIDVPSRIRAGFALGQLGDPRPGVCSLEPDWCDVPAGPFLLGSKPDDAGAYEDEQPQRSVELPAFRIARHPVTNAQWQHFIDDHGYQKPKWWSEAGWALVQEAGLTVPRLWGDPRFNGSNQPVVGITWYEATAYCRWLSARLGYEVRLPSESEWEKAARGTDGWAYPWGNSWDAAKANTAESSIGSTTPVGCYPDGACPCGALDMSGNVIEWTATPWEEDYQDSDGTVIDMEGQEKVSYVWRGGAWGDYLRSARCTSRGRYRSSYRNYTLGLRVVVALTTIF